MTITYRENIYQGVNAHLHSIAQSGLLDWSSFHGRHVNDIAEFLDNVLPVGYSVLPEQSLQIMEYHPDIGERLRRPKPDVTVGVDFSRQPSPTNDSGFGVATLTAPVAETLALLNPEYFTAVMIYAVEGHNPIGKPVLRLEVLSPTNKRGGNGDIQYAEKRAATLKSGVRLVEVDYLHESHPMIAKLPVYPVLPNSYPYHITVSDPLTIPDAQARVYGFRVDQPIPTLTLSLLGEDTLDVDFNIIYQRSYQSLRAYSQLVDYSTEPPSIERYADMDQAAIRAVMQRAAKKGV